jgi:4'-phosphopantetheinyl transferase
MRLAWTRLDGKDGHDAAYALLEQLVGTPLPPIRRTELGKPYFADGGPHFSISHTTNHAFCCVSERNIGIDAEEIGRRVNLRLANKILSVGEKALFDTAMDKQDCLLRLWVLKESYAKLTGRGIGNHLKSTDFSPDDPRIQIIDGCYVAVMEE